jgi:hypothetical protein
VSASGGSAPPCTASVDRPSAFGAPLDERAPRSGKGAAATAAVQVRFDHAHDLRRRGTGDVAQRNVALPLVRVDVNDGELVTPWAVHPSELPVDDEARARVIGVHPDGWTTLGITAP